MLHVILSDAHVALSIIGAKGYYDKGPVINYGEGGEQVNFYPYEKRGGWYLSHAEGRAQNILGWF